MGWVLWIGVGAGAGKVLGAVGMGGEVGVLDLVDGVEHVEGEGDGVGRGIER